MKLNKELLRCWPLEVGRFVVPEVLQHLALLNAGEARHSGPIRNLRIAVQKLETSAPEFSHIERIIEINTIVWVSNRASRRIQNAIDGDWPALIGGYERSISVYIRVVSII